MRRPLAFCISLLAASPAAASSAMFQFCWIGGGGYTMEGTIEFPERYLDTTIITEEEVTGFRILGRHNGIPIGSWSLQDRLPDTSWTLFFDTRSLEFPTGGIRSQRSYQAWNAHGAVNDCGAGGFGFNAGNYAQDVCVDNTFITVSSIDRDTPLKAYPMDVALTCESAAAMM